MCSYSMIADHFTDRWRIEHPNYYQWQPTFPAPDVTRVEFEQLRKEVADLKNLLIKAKEYDAINGQPDCEMDEKVEILRKIAKLVGVDLGAALPSTPGP